MVNTTQNGSYYDQVALVTGAASGIGFAISQMLANKGSKLVMIDINPDISAIAKNIGERHLGLSLDVSKDDCGDRAVKAAIETFGKIDILVNNVGIGPLAPAEDFPLDIWDATMSINLRSAFLFAKAVSPFMINQKYGRIVNMSSQAATVGIDGHLAYCTSKAGLLGMTRCMALEWGKHNITVNAVSPTVTETELGRMSWSGKKGEEARAAIPTGRFALPEEVASSVIYLASQEAAMINGANLAIDGGFTIQ